MVSKRDAQIIGQWLQSQASPHTRDCYRRDADRLLNHVRKPLNRIGLCELQSFTQALVDEGLAPVSRARMSGGLLLTIYAKRSESVREPQRFCLRFSTRTAQSSQTQPTHKPGRPLPALAYTGLSMICLR